MMTERKMIYLDDALEAIRKLPNAGIHWFVSAEAVFDALLKLPSVQSERKWIQCSERLPEDDKSVLATTEWGDVTIAERVYPPINDTCWFIHDGNTNATFDDVIAWMPLPKPYEEDI